MIAKALASGDASYCSTSECKGIVKRDASYCNSGDCKGWARMDPELLRLLGLQRHCKKDKSYCQTNFCKGIASGDASYRDDGVCKRPSSATTAATVRSRVAAKGYRWASRRRRMSTATSISSTVT